MLRPGTQGLAAVSHSVLLPTTWQLQTVSCCAAVMPGSRVAQQRPCRAQLFYNPSAASHQPPLALRHCPAAKALPAWHQQLAEVLPDCSCRPFLRADMRRQCLAAATNMVCCVATACRGTDVWVPGHTVEEH